jgi:ribosomal protein S18 acetylase RimI-like enzyme
MSVLAEEAEEFERAHQKIQKGMYFSDFVKTPSFKLCYSGTILVNDWNYATFVRTEDRDIHSLVSEIISEFVKIDRDPTIYITPSSSNQVERYLLDNGWETSFSDSWMIHDEKHIDEGKLDLDIDLVRSDSPDDVASFMECFISCYGGPVSEDNPYGELPEYFVTALRSSFDHEGPERRIINLIGTLNEECVGIGTVIVYRDYAGIYNMGTVPEMRRNGICRALTGELIGRARERNAEKIFLMTETDEGPERAYQRLGFDRIFVGKGYTKSATSSAGDVS